MKSQKIAKILVFTPAPITVNLSSDVQNSRVYVSTSPKLSLSARQNTVAGYVTVNDSITNGVLTLTSSGFNLIVLTENQTVKNVEYYFSFFPAGGATIKKKVTVSVNQSTIDL